MKWMESIRHKTNVTHSCNNKLYNFREEALAQNFAAFRPNSLAYNSVVWLFFISVLPYSLMCLFSETWVSKSEVKSLHFYSKTIPFFGQIVPECLMWLPNECSKCALKIYNKTCSRLTSLTVIRIYLFNQHFLNKTLLLHNTYFYLTTLD